MVVMSFILFAAVVVLFFTTFKWAYKKLDTKRDGKYPKAQTIVRRSRIAFWLAAFLFALAVILIIPKDDGVGMLVFGVAMFELFLALVAVFVPPVFKDQATNRKEEYAAKVVKLTAIWGMIWLPIMLALYFIGKLF